MGTSQDSNSSVREGDVDTKKAGSGRDPGTYVGTVVEIVKGNSIGQLKVFIPEWNSTHTVDYASPFYGRTLGTDTQLTPNQPVTAGQSYGMWMVPPDLNCKVLCVFAGSGDQSKGFWFACCYDSDSHHMIPALGRNVGGPSDTTTVPDELQSKLSKDSVVPVVESNTADPKAFTADGVTKTPRFPHEYQSYVLIGQGLDRDKIRGAISSSSLRETPSNVYGISTPGRKVTKTDQNPNNPQAVFSRTGGHSFVMDDGSAADGTDQLIRLRTAGGHQILMNDTENILYVASKSGYQWLEFSKDGSVNMYAYAGFNLRTVGPMNFHSDSSIIMNSGGTVAINGDTGVNITSLASTSMSGLVSATVKTDGILSLTGMAKASLTSVGWCDVGASTGITSVGSSGGILKLGIGLPLPLPAIPPIPNKLPEVQLNGSSWQRVDESLNSICTVVPCHEPWTESNGTRPPPARGTGILGQIAIAGAAIGIGKAVGSIGAGFSV
jgi:hypothetical protein